MYLHFSDSLIFVALYASQMSMIQSFPSLSGREAIGAVVLSFCESGSYRFGWVF